MIPKSGYRFSEKIMLKKSAENENGGPKPAVSFSRSIVDQHQDQ
jgi:hypothetical protein